MDTITVGNETFHVMPIAYDDIQPGYTILHAFQSPEDGSFVSVGIAEEKGQNTGEWFGPWRRTAQRPPFGEFSPFTLNNSGDVLVTAPWHATEEGHTIYRVI